MARRPQLALADGSTAAPTLVADGASASVDWPGGDGAYFAVGTFGGGTFTLQMLSPDGTTWVSLGTIGALTATGVVGFSAPAGKMRASLSGSAGPSLKAWVVGLPTNNAG